MYANSVLSKVRTEILGAFAKLQRATISFVMCVCVCLSVCLSVLREQLGFHWANSNEIWHWGIFRKFVGRNQVSLRSEKNNGYFTWIPMYIYDQINLNSS
jgi:hypothetical protein